MNLSTAQTSTQRALAAIVLTDAVSFSARMSVDEEATLNLIQRDLKLMSDLCNHYGGQVLKSTGDGLLMSFSSAAQAVSCSQEIQKELANLAEGLVPEEYLKHRIGIHLGDVLFSHGDVLGNGVNIAARLQSRSTPGGICISQTVHDVVKARLDMQATFLGPLQLKNIKEPVPAFQIPPIGESGTLVVQVEPQSLDNQVAPLVIIAQTLQQDTQQHRIKKLIFGTCQGLWENDPAVLSQFELLPLLEKLHHRHSTLASLETALRSMAARLNRKAEYMAIADTILKSLKPIYQEQAVSVEVSQKESLQLTETQMMYQEIATSLTQQGEQLRIRKLLYAVVHATWENDPTLLAQQVMTDLIAAVHKIAPTETDLSDHLEYVIQRLNHQSRYTQVGLLISEAFQHLYGTLAPESEAIEPESEVADLAIMSAEDQTMAIHEAPVSHEIPVSQENITSATRLASPTQLSSVTELSGVTQLSGEHTVTHTTLSPGDTSDNSALDNMANLPQPKERDRANLFSLRLEIMRYTSPLRAKILLMSTVRSPFAFSQQDWIALKSKTLDDLIQETFNYCKTYADLESKLTIICHCVDNAADNQQTAGAILQAMKPFYPIAASS